jgi:FtsP/CotA-like multicopper oxidase with cupredoxin domain
MTLTRALTAALIMLCAAFAIASLHASARTPLAAPCGAPIPSGALIGPPQIEMSRLPLNDLGRHELILAVQRDGDRFCYTYAIGGVKHHTAPVLRVHRGEEFALRVVNELDGPAPGATMAANALQPCMPRAMPAMSPRHYAGYLNHTIDARAMPPMTDDDVNMHFHGFQGPAREENVFLSTLSTPAHACEYDVTIPRTQPPGTYLYHPHAHGMADDEVAGGLIGMWIVEPDTPQIPLRDEHPILLTYRVPFESNNPSLPSGSGLGKAAVAHEAALKPAQPVAYDPFNPPPWPSSLPVRAGKVALPGMCGSRPGSLISVNGVDAPAALTVPAGEPQLFRILNATSDSMEFIRLRDTSGRLQTLRVVGRDGVPVGADFSHPLARFVAMQEAALDPTQRIDVLLQLKPGEVLTLYGASHCNAPYDELQVKTDLLTIRAGAPLAAPARVASQPLVPAQSPAAELLAFARAHPQLVRRRAFTYTEYALPNANGRGGHSEYYITETSNSQFHEDPFWPAYQKGAETPDPDVIVKHGSIEEWYLFNATMETHSFHIHQMDFVDEGAADAPATVDTAMLPFGTLLPNKADPDYPLVKPSLTRILLDFRHVPRGTFVFHCHMLFHEDRGMMKVVRVE